LVIKQKLESGNYTDEELNNLLDRTQRITEKQEGILYKFNKDKKDILLIVSSCMIAALKIVIENRNNKA
jgi:hypothetical protein